MSHPLCRAIERGWSCRQLQLEGTCRMSRPGDRGVAAETVHPKNFESSSAREHTRPSLKWRSRIAFGNQTISGLAETHGFAPLPRGRFAFIVCNHRLIKIIAIAKNDNVQVD